MQLDIQVRDFSLSDALRRHAELRLLFAMRPFHDRIRVVVMRLSDINGPRGGADKRCLLKVVLAGLPDVVIEDIQADLYVAIDRATERARNTVARKLARRRWRLDEGRPRGSDLQQSPSPANKRHGGAQS